MKRCPAVLVMITLVLAVVLALFACGAPVAKPVPSAGGKSPAAPVKLAQTQIG